MMCSSCMSRRTSQKWTATSQSKYHNQPDNISKTLKIAWNLSVFVHTHSNIFDMLQLILKRKISILKAKKTNKHPKNKNKRTKKQQQPQINETKLIWD